MNDFLLWLERTARAGLGAAVIAGCSPEVDKTPTDAAPKAKPVDAVADGSESSMGTRSAKPFTDAVDKPTLPRPTEIPAVSPEGYGPVRIGMTIAEASRVLHSELTPISEYEQNSCRHYRSAALPEGLVFMGQNGRITRVTLHQNSMLRTDRGLGLGTSEAAVRKAYGSALEVEAHHYLGEPAHYFTAWSADRKNGIRYETDVDGIVREIHAGDESIQLVEGCS